MSNRERIIELLDSIPDYKIGYVLAYVRGVAADEEADEIFFAKGWLRAMRMHRPRIKKVFRLQNV